jgi:hypothetical protein
MKCELLWILNRAFRCAIAFLLAQGLTPAAWAASSAESAAAHSQRAMVHVQAQNVECPTTAQVEMALHQVLIPDESVKAGWVLSYGRDWAVPGADRRSSIWMELRNPTGQSVDRRQLPYDDGDCVAVANAMAAVVERSLHTLGWTRGEPLPEASWPKRQVPGPTRLPRLILGVGPALGTSAQLGTNLLVEARVNIARSFSMRLGGSLFAGNENQTVSSGRALITSHHVSAAGLSTLTRGKVYLDTGLVLLISIDQGKTEGLTEDSNGRRASLAAGLLLGAGVQLSPRWRIAVGIEGLHAVAGTDFLVNLDRGGTVVLPPPTWQAIALTKLEFVIWP